MEANTTVGPKPTGGAESIAPEIITHLQEKFGVEAIAVQPTRDEIPSFWTPVDKLHGILNHLKTEIDRPYRAFYDLTAIDERERNNRQGQPQSDFTVVYHLLSYDRNQYIRVKAALQENHLSVPTVTDLWPGANWYEREI